MHDNEHHTNNNNKREALINNGENLFLRLEADNLIKLDLPEWKCRNLIFQSSINIRSRSKQSNELNTLANLNF